MTALLQYEVTVEDAEAFALYHHQRSALLRSRARFLRLGLSILIAVIAAAVGALTDSTFIGGVGLALAIGYWLVFPRRWQLGLRQTVRRMYAEGRNAGVLGPHELRIEEAFLTEATPMREVRTRWAAIEACEETPDHVFVYVTGSTALILPRRSIDPSALEPAVAEIRRRMKAE